MDQFSCTLDPCKVLGMVHVDPQGFLGVMIYLIVGYLKICDGVHSFGMLAETPG